MASYKFNSLTRISERERKGPRKSKKNWPRIKGKYVKIIHLGPLVATTESAVLLVPAVTLAPVNEEGEEEEEEEVDEAVANEDAEEEETTEAKSLAVNILA